MKSTDLDSCLGARITSWPVQSVQKYENCSAGFTSGVFRAEQVPVYHSGQHITICPGAIRLAKVVSDVTVRALALCPLKKHMPATRWPELARRRVDQRRYWCDWWHTRQGLSSVHQRIAHVLWRLWLIFTKEERYT